MDARKAGFEAYVIEDATRGIDLNGSLAAAWKQMAAKPASSASSRRTSDRRLSPRREEPTRITRQTTQ